MLKFLSENKIFLSTENALNDFMYYKHVIKFKEQQTTKSFLTELNLESDFF